MLFFVEKVLNCEELKRNQKQCAYQIFHSINTKNVYISVPVKNQSFPHRSIKTNADDSKKGVQENFAQTQSTIEI